MNKSQLDKFKQIVIEFHGIHNNSYNCKYADKVKCLEKLTKHIISYMIIVIIMGHD
jgi:hypothetical protein